MARSRLVVFFRLPHRERAVLLLGIGTLALARVALWILPFPLVRRIFAQPKVKAAPYARWQIRWAVQRAQRVVPRATCLPQAIAAESMLLRNGFDAALRLGVMKKPDGSFEAHAWVESGGGIVIGDLPPAEMSALTPLPPVPMPHAE